MVETIGNPLSWTAKTIGRGVRGTGDIVEGFADRDTAPIRTRPLTGAMIATALRRGRDDFLALRSDVIFVVLVYPVIGFALVWLAANRQAWPLVFPLLSGFALLGPVAAVGLYEMSRRRERGARVRWRDAFAVIASPSVVPIIVLGVYLLAIFVAWMFTAYVIYVLTLGPQPPVSAEAFLRDVLTTGPGWAMLGLGVGIGAGFAALVLIVSLISFPLLLDRRVGIPRAVGASVRIARTSPGAVLAWGAIVTLGLVIGMATLLIGMIFVLPILGHATWHLYRQVVTSGT